MPTIDSNSRASESPWLTRGRLAAFCIILAAANGLLDPALQSVAQHGWPDALVASFGTSKLVWLALLAGSIQLFRAASPASGAADFIWAFPGLLITLAPASAAAWLGGLLIALAAGLKGGFRGAERTGLLVLLAVCLREIVDAANPIVGHGILSLDTALVEWIRILAGGESDRIGNLFVAPDGRSLLISVACNSLANCSLAVLTWFVITAGCVRAWRKRYFVAGASVLAAAWILNVSRLGFMSLNPDWYGYMHDGPGARWIRLALMLLTLLFTLVSLGSGHDENRRPRFIS